MSRAVIALAAGGTGGHMFPAEALARALVGRGLKVAMVTDTRGGAFGGADLDVEVYRVRAATVGAGYQPGIELRCPVQWRRLVFDQQRSAPPGLAVHAVGHA